MQCMHIEADWVIHASNLIIEFVFFPLLTYAVLYVRLGLWYKFKRITGYYTDIDDQGKAGPAIVKISFNFPNRVEIMGLEGNGVTWLGKDYTISHGTIVGRFHWNMFRNQGGPVVADYGSHDIQILPEISPLTVNVISTDISGGGETHKSKWRKMNDRKKRNEVKKRMAEFIRKARV
jgi:hypothetical protein